MNLPDSQIQYVDLPDLAETFADSVKLSVFDGTVARIEFCTTRLKDLGKTKKPEAQRHPVCRLVLTPAAAAELFKQLQNMINAMVQTGALKPVEQPKGDVTKH